LTICQPRYHHAGLDCDGCGCSLWSMHAEAVFVQVSTLPAHLHAQQQYLVADYCLARETRIAVIYRQNQPHHNVQMHHSCSSRSFQS
jgi:hypothetical protein